MWEILALIIVLIGIVAVIAYLLKDQVLEGDNPLGLKGPAFFADFNNKVSGRIAGKLRYKGDAVDIPYRCGFFGGRMWVYDIPLYALRTLDPPKTPHKEGLVLVLPYDSGRPTGFKVWDEMVSLHDALDFHRNILEKDIANLKHRVETSVDKDKLMKELKDLSDHFAVFGKSVETQSGKIKGDLALEEKEKRPVFINKSGKMQKVN